MIGDSSTLPLPYTPKPTQQGYPSLSFSFSNDYSLHEFFTHLGITQDTPNIENNNEHQLQYDHNEWASDCLLFIHMISIS